MGNKTVVSMDMIGSFVDLMKVFFLAQIAQELMYNRKKATTVLP